jgi:hypothetical protein
MEKIGLEFKVKARRDHMPDEVKAWSEKVGLNWHSKRPVEFIYPCEIFKYTQLNGSSFSGGDS